jgi:hypothetical protein
MSCGRGGGGDVVGRVQSAGFPEADPNGLCGAGESNDPPRGRPPEVKDLGVCPDDRAFALACRMVACVYHFVRPHESLWQ